jgi:hypothetical protein
VALLIGFSLKLVEFQGDRGVIWNAGETKQIGREEMIRIVAAIVLLVLTTQYVAAEMSRVSTSTAQKQIIGGTGPHVSAATLVDAVYADTSRLVPIVPAASLTDNPACMHLTSGAEGLRDMVTEIRGGHYGDYLASLARFEDMLRCLGERSTRSVDLALSISIYRSAELPAKERDALLMALLNPALFVLDQIEHTGHAWVPHAIKARETAVRNVASAYPKELGVWFLDRRTGTIVRIPGKTCAPDPTSCKNTIEQFMEALLDPRQLGDGSCSMADMVVSGFHCRSSHFGCDDTSLGGRRAFEKFSQALLGDRAFRPDSNRVLGGAAQPDDVHPSPRGEGDPYSVFGTSTHELQDYLCGRSSPAADGNPRLSLEATYHCMLEQQRARQPDSMICKAALLKETTVEGRPLTLDTNRAPLDSRCRFKDSPGGGEQPSGTTTSTRTPTADEQKALNKFSAAATAAIDQYRKDKNAKALTEKLRYAITQLNTALTLATPTPTVASVQSALQTGSKASVQEIYPSTSDLAGGRRTAEDNKSVIGVRVDQLSNPDDAVDTITHEKWHVVLHELKIPAGPNEGDFHHDIMKYLGVVSISQYSQFWRGAKDTLEQSRGVDACSSEADKLDQQMNDCERDALERAIELGFGHHRPPLTDGGIVDPRKINPSPEWVPPDPTGLSSCLGLSGDQIPSDPRQCAFLICADPFNCSCGTPAEPGGPATTNENTNTVRPSCTEMASSGGGSASTPFPCNTTTAAAKPSTCLAINCGEQELDRATCFCKPREAGTREGGGPPRPTTPR